MINFRPYQETFTADISSAFREGCRRVVGSMATGSGKGTVAAGMAQRAAAKGRMVLILAHRKELIEDLSNRIGSAGVPHGVIAANRSMDLSLPVQIASVDTIARRLHQVPAPTLIIQDEAHHLIVGNKWGKVIAAWPNAFLVGLTATPERLSGEGLGEGHGGYFQRLILGPSPQWLTDEGYLSRAKILQPPPCDELSSIKRFDTVTGREKVQQIMMRPQAIGDPVGYYRRYIAPVHTGTVLGFCVSIPHAEMMEEMYRREGIPSASLSGKTDPQLRRQMIADLGTGKLRALFSCEIISEGTDIPSVTGVQLFRPTDSLTLYLQQVGRCLRTIYAKGYDLETTEGRLAAIDAGGKPFSVVLDHVGNSHRHGYPTDLHPWSLEGKAKRKQGERPPSVKVCPSCFCSMPSASQKCPECGHQFVAERRELEHIDGELIEVDPAQVARQKKREQATARTLDQLIALGKERNMRYPHVWARKVLAARQQRAAA
jgi:DNA repair protein RadD